MWKQISFKQFVDGIQNLGLGVTGTLENSGYFMEWDGKYRYESRPHVRADMDTMELYLKKGK